MARRQWRKGLVAGVTVACVALGILIVRHLQGQAEPYPGTDVRIAAGNPSGFGAGGDCYPYSSNLRDLVANSDSIVLGTVTSDRPFFEGTYGTAAPRQDDGSLNARRGDFLNRLIGIDVEQTVAGTPVNVADLIVEGWIYNSTGDKWTPIAFSGNHRLETGDRAIFAMNRSAPADPVATANSFALTCTGPFVIQGGTVQPKPGATEFQDDGVWKMSETELIEAIRNAAE